MKRKITCLVTLCLILSVSAYGASETNNDAFSKSYSLQNQEENLPSEDNDLTESIFAFDKSDSPDELHLMSYAQTVLEDFFPKCKYSRNTNEYKFIGTDLRYKIEGEVSVDSASSYKNFYMIIQFEDDKYETYDLISLQVGDDTIYKSEITNFATPSDECEILNEENTKIYNEVMNKLDTDIRDEDEILEEMAPQYNMTASELKEFIFAYMDAYYLK